MKTLSAQLLSTVILDGGYEIVFDKLASFTVRTLYSFAGGVALITSSPGLQGIEMATDIDIATKIIEHIEKHARPIGPKSRYQG